MTRVAVIGNAGGGKSTLSRALSHKLGLPYRPLDQVQWRPGWVPAEMEEIARAQETWLREDRWIIDGVGPLALVEARLAAADTIVFVDLPLWRHYWWAAKRQVMSLFRPRPDGLAGGPMLPVAWRLARMIWWIDRTSRPELIRLIERNRGRKAVHHLRGPREIAAFLEAARSV